MYELLGLCPILKHTVWIKHDTTNLPLHPEQSLRVSLPAFLVTLSRQKPSPTQMMQTQFLGVHMPRGKNLKRYPRHAMFTYVYKDGDGRTTLFASGWGWECPAAKLFKRGGCQIWGKAPPFC